VWRNGSNDPSKVLSNRFIKQFLIMQAIVINKLRCKNYTLKANMCIIYTITKKLSQFFPAKSIKQKIVYQNNTNKKSDNKYLLFVAKNKCIKSRFIKSRKVKNCTLCLQFNKVCFMQLCGIFYRGQ